MRSLANLRTPIQFSLEGLGQGCAQLVSVAIKPLIPQLVPCFSFSPSQQGTWSLLGANYWPSVGLGWWVGRGSSCWEDCLWRKSGFLLGMKKIREEKALLLYESKTWGGGSFHPFLLPTLPLPVFSLLPNPDPHRFNHEESTACLWSLPLEFPPTAENRDRISSRPPLLCC